MKKLRYFGFVLLLLVVSTACGVQDNSSSASNAGNMATVDDVLSAQMEAEDDTASGDVASSDSANSAASDSAADASAESDASSGADSGVDVDITGLSATMVYAEMYNMVTMPLVYHGKTIKLTGYYDEYFDVMTDTLYCSVFVMDALACCAQGLQVEFSDDYAYPDDYPDDGAEITITATFEVYYPDDTQEYFYYHLVDAVVLN